MKAPAALPFTCALLAVSACGGSSGAGSTHPATATAPAKAPTSQAGTAPAGSSVTAVAGPTAHTVSATLAGVRATMTAGTHSPRVNVPWPILITLRSGNRPVRGSGSYEFLFGVAVVAHRSHYTLLGRFTDTILWPASAVGYPLTFRAAIVSEGHTFNLDFPVQVGR